jgi:predicted 3-demethylubiquinone-9 3-methyltransferase (glyoxalase superfamily)
MPRLGTCLWFEKDAEPAVRFYTALLPDSSIDHIQHAPALWPGGNAGDVLLIAFTLAGQSFQALNGGTKAEYGLAASISVQCQDQPEIDRLWSAITANGGTELECGWLRDRWGIPWQIVPEILPHLLANPTTAPDTFAALQTMIKLDTAALERAALG